MYMLLVTLPKMPSLLIFLTIKSAINMATLEHLLLAGPYTMNFM